MDREIINGVRTVSLFCRMQMRRRMNIPIRPSEMGVLIYVHEETQPVTPLMISEYFRMKKPSVTSMVRTLTRKGYLMKKPSDTDGRSYTLMCTDEGIDLVRSTFDDYHNAIGRLRQEMGEEMFNQFIGLMDEANTILSKETVK